MKARQKNESGLKFSINSLDDLAAHFDRMADVLVTQSSTPTTTGAPLPSTRVLSLLAEAMGFRNAAKMTRNAILEKEDDNG
jgi:hypothetical protein